MNRRSSPNGSRHHAPSHLRRAPAAAATAATGLLTIGAQLSEVVLSGRHLRSNLPLLPLHAFGIAGGIGLLVLALGLWHGKRSAAQVAIVALALIGSANLIFGLSAPGAAIELATAGFILFNLSAFRRGSEPGPSRSVTGGAPLAAGAIVYGLYAVLAMGATQGTEVDRVITSASGVLPDGTVVAGTASHPGLLVNASIAAVVVLGWTVLRALLRPALPEDGHSRDEHERAAVLVRKYGQDSLDPFTLREDKALFFDGQAFLAYRVLHETAVVSGDPVGPPGSAPEILASFVRFAERHDWNVVITAASERHLAACGMLGLRTLEIGEEAVVDPREFTLEGRRIRKVRQSVARVERHGWRVDIVRDEEVSADLDRELAEVEADWRSRQPRLIGFAMTLGRLTGPADRGGGIYALGRDPDGRLRSFLRFAPYRSGLSLDLMRRAAEEPNGLTEALVVAAISHARERGLRAVSLNFAGFAHVMAADAALSRSQRVLRVLLRLFHGRFQLERLVRFNAKFFPRWQPRYLVYDGLGHLPVSALRVLQAEAYLPAPAPERRGILRNHGWFRVGASAAALCAGLTASTLLLAGSSNAHARPLRVSAHPAKGGWSFVYGRHGVRTHESSLYLPKDRRVILRVVGRQDPSSGSSDIAEADPGGRIVHLDPLHRGDLTVPCGKGRISADVVGPKTFRAAIQSLAKGNPLSVSHTT
jgi:lysyl-tRNA synthetase, class II